MDRDHHLIIIIIIIIMGMDMGTDMDMDMVEEMTDHVAIHVAIIMIIIIMMTDAVAVVVRNGSDMIHIIRQIVKMDVGIINIMVRGVRMTIIHHRGM